MKQRAKLELSNEDNMQLMARYPDSYFDLAIVDPPYGIGESNKKQRTRKKHVNRVIHAAKSWDNSAPKKTYFKELERVSKNRIIWGGNYMTDNLPPSPCWLIWNKGFSEEVSFAQFEMAWASFSSSAKKFDYNSAKNKQRIHPTQKPVKLYEWILDKYAKEGDKILDTHLGSGSIAIACQNRGFDLTACELDKEYFEAATKRIETATAQTNIFDYI